MQQARYQQGGLKEQQSAFIDTEEDEKVERKSLYELVRDKREVYENNPNPIENPPVARLLYAAYLNEGIKEASKIDIDQQISDVIKYIEQSDQEGDYETSKYNQKLSGFLLIKGNFILHFLEGDSNVINNKFIRDYLYSEYKKEKSVFLNINIICFSEENPFQLYEKHSTPNSGVFQSGPQLSTDIDKTEQQIQDRTWEIYNQFCEVGKKYSDQKKTTRDKQSKKMENEINLSNDDMSMLMAKVFMSIEDYYEMYLDDIEINLDSEVVFPYTPSLITNLEYSERGYFPQVKP